MEVLTERLYTTIDPRTIVPATVAVEDAKTALFPKDREDKPIATGKDGSLYAYYGSASEEFQLVGEKPGGNCTIEDVRSYLDIVKERFADRVGFLPDKQVRESYVLGAAVVPVHISRFNFDHLDVGIWRRINERQVWATWRRRI